MSKAFPRESDDEDDAPARPLGSELPPSVKNYVTPEGAAKLRAEIDRLSEIDRPSSVKAGDTRATREIDRRLAFLGQRFAALEVIDPASQPPGRVLFGAIVVVRGEDGAERRVRLVGVDEADPPRGDVSWRSPIARALLGSRVGDVVVMRSPHGDEELEIVSIAF